MDLSQFSNASTPSTGAQVQGAQGHHHHRKSMSDQLSDMNTAIDNAVKAGKLTNDQATAMKKELDDVKQTLSQSQTSGSSQTGASTLSADDRKKVFGELQDVRKQLHTATAPQGTAAGATGDQIDKLFSSMDADANGSVSKEEFEAFMSSLPQGGYTAQGTPSGSSSSGLSIQA